MEISVAKKQAYSEVYEIINLLDIEYIDKIPKKILRYFDENRDKEYHKNINPFQDISTQNLKKDTIVIFSMLNLKYFASQAERAELTQIYDSNQSTIQEEYSYENIFKESVAAEPPKPVEPPKETEQLQMVPVKEENIFVKIWNFIRSLFK